MLELILQGKNLDFCLWWLDPMTAGLEHGSLPFLKALLLKNFDVRVVLLNGLCGYGPLLYIADHGSDHFKISFFFSPTQSFGLI